MIRIELKHIKKGGYFKFENNPSSKYWQKGKSDKNAKGTWVYFYNRSIESKLVKTNIMVYTKLEYIKASKNMNLYDLK